MRSATDLHLLLAGLALLCAVAQAAEPPPAGVIVAPVRQVQFADTIEALGTVGGLADQRANKTGVYVFRMGDLQKNPTARARVFRLDLYQPVSIFIAQQFPIQARDVIYVTNAPLYEYDKILTSIYRTFSIVGVARGTVIPATSF